MITLVVVNYRSAELARSALRSARAASNEQLETVVVDNSACEGIAGEFEGAADRVLSPERNLGYGAAVNLAARDAAGDVLIASNPDVTYDSGSIDLLASVTRTRRAVTGPALFWDSAYRWKLPPADAHDAVDKVDEIVATRSSRWRRMRDRRRVRQRLAFWAARETRDVRALSGAVLAFPKAAYDSAGGFDERFFLYFEETDLLRRIRASGTPLLYVPAARVRHAFNQSARLVDAGSHFSRSERLYRDKWHGGWVTSLLRFAGRPEEVPMRASRGLPVTNSRALVEVSPLASFDAAAGTFADGGVIDLPAEVWASVGDAPLYMRTVDPSSARVIDTVRCLPPP